MEPPPSRTEVRVAPHRYAHRHAGTVIARTAFHRARPAPRPACVRRGESMARGATFPPPCCRNA